MFQREVLTANPPEGDFILSPTGYSWNVRRSLGNGSVQGIAAGERKKAIAVASLLSLAETNKTDAWETVGTGVFWATTHFQLGEQMSVFLVNPSDVSFGTAVITPRWLYVLAAATPGTYGDPVVVD